jgi:G3E family GTPase
MAPVRRLAARVTLITGCLGSGKTTLLQRLLRDPALSDTAVLINEFGEIGLDHHLLGGIDETMVMLQSGCVCCTIRGELSAAIKDLHSRRERGLLPPFRRLIIESTGLADPFPILSTVRSDPVLRHHFCLGNVITTVDAVNGAQQLDAQPRQVLTCWMSFAQRSRIGRISSSSAGADALHRTEFVLPPMVSLTIERSHRSRGRKNER